MAILHFASCVKTAELKHQTLRIYTRKPRVDNDWLDRPRTPRAHDVKLVCVLVMFRRPQLEDVGIDCRSVYHVVEHHPNALHV